MDRFFYQLMSVVVLAMFVFTDMAKATNPPITNNMFNLSEGDTEYGLDDRASEMVIDGNTIHTIWIQFEYGNSVKLYYRRSTDLGDTWESPVLLYEFIDKYSAEPELRRLAVDNGVVHIAFPDYDYNDNGTGKLLYIRSTNGGASFETPIEIANSGGGYNYIGNSYIKAVDGKVAIAYSGEGAQAGTRMLFSADGGNSFTETLIFDESAETVDLFFDGQQIIVLHQYTYYFYGLSVGKVWVSVSNDYGNTFITNKVSKTGEDDNERCIVSHDDYYSRKIAKAGNNIYLIFEQRYEGDNYTVIYTHSTDNGVSFAEAVDINNGVVGGTYLRGQETIAAKGNHVYMTYLDVNGKAYWVKSDDAGNTLSEPADLLTDDTEYLQGTWWIQLICDPNDATGATVYFGGANTLCRVSTDGGETFSHASFVMPILETQSDCQAPQLVLDANGGIHWIMRGRWYFTYDYDVFYGKIASQPDPGETNKAYHIQTVYSEKRELAIVPSSPTLQFTDKLTAEAWVKILPGNESKFNIFAKVNGGDSWASNPSGFNLGFELDSWDVPYLNAGIKTDLGDYVNWSSGKIEDNLWHHVAFTYDADAVPNNFKTYLDGLLVAEQTATGNIVTGDGLFMIGSRGAFDVTSDYELDEIRLWDRALTQEELLANQNRDFTGEEEGLRLYLNFDDTFKDISGNGNDAIPLYLGSLETSDFDPPVAGFEMYQTVSEVAFNNTSVNATAFEWDFGDEQTSLLGFPTHVYDTPGEYHVSMRAKNANSVTGATKPVTIYGLDRVAPCEAGNVGYTTITVFGGGLVEENTTILLRKDGETDLEGFNYVKSSKSGLSGIFYLQDATIGDWDVVVVHNGNEQVMPEALQIKQGDVADPWVNFSGRGNILFNTWSGYAVEYGNNGNADAYGVPLWLVFSDDPGFDISFVDVHIDLPAAAVESGLEATRDSIPLFFIVEDYFGEGKDGRVYPFYIPVILAHSSETVHLRIKTSGDLEIESWVSDPYFSGAVEEGDLVGAVFREDIPFSDMNADARACIGLSMTKVVAEGLVGLAGVALPVNCIHAAMTNFYNPWDYRPKSATNQVPTWGSGLWSITSLVIGCAEDLPYFKAYKLTKAVLALGASMYDAYQADKACRDAWLKKSKKKRNIGAVSSFDPNEMVGPAGFGESKYIKPNRVLPYSVYFENKSDASAPAHHVRISDTLDLTKYDLADFGFGAFGFGDTIVQLPGYDLKEFSVDIDLRPAIATIARVTGKLDDSTGIITWDFYSLHPETMTEEEDPAIGFLPPNITSPEGEGFVSYHTGLKQDLPTDTEVKNKAGIVFDGNPPIITNEYRNTLDVDVPESQVNELPDAVTGNTFTVTWGGNDAGSGIGSYSIWVLVNDTLLIPWKTDTTATSAEFSGVIGYNYKFYSIAVDNVNWIENTPDAYDAETNIVVGIEEQARNDANLVVFPNPAKGRLYLKLREASRNRYRVEMTDLTGRVFYEKTVEGTQLKTGISIGLKHCQVGAYVLRVVSEDGAFVQKIVVK